MHNDYYTSQSRKLLKQLDNFLIRARPILVERCRKEAATAIHQETLEEYERLIPQIPYIGGRKNPLTDNLIQCVWALALYRVLQRRDWTLEAVGELIHRSVEANLNRIPAFLRRWMGKFAFTGWYRHRQQKNARRSQDRQYPGDWFMNSLKVMGSHLTLGWTLSSAALSNSSTRKEPTN